MNELLITKLPFLVLVFIVIGCQRSYPVNNAPSAPSNHPFPQRERSIATYNVKPMLPGNQAEAERKMIELLKNILNNNLIFDSRAPLNSDEFRIVLEHHTQYPMGSYPGINEQHINVSESQGYGMLILAYMAGCEDALTDAGHSWRFGAASLKDYFDGMLRTVLAFQSPIYVDGEPTRQYSWELFGHNTGENETGFSINNSIEVYRRGFRYYENSAMSPKIAPFANTPGGGPDGGEGETNYNRNGTSSATDGDMDIMYALILADKQWGSNGEFNYRQIALDMLEGFWRAVTHMHYRTLLLGDWAAGNPGTNSLRNGTRPSDFILSHLRAYKAFDPAHNWQEVIDATLEVITDIRDDLHAGGAPNNGLLPDFARKLPSDDKWQPAPPNFLEGANDGRYNWNSCRTPWRFGTDYLLYGNTQMTGDLSNPSLFNYIIEPLDNFAKARVGSDRNNMNGLGTNYTLDSPLQNVSQSANPGFAAPFLVTAAAVGNDQEWVDAFWRYSGMSNFQNNWYADYYKLIAMIAASGNYWKPEAM